MEQSSPDEPESPKTLDAGQPFCRKDKFRRSFDRQSYRRLQRTNSVNYGSKNNITDLKRLFETNVEVKTSSDKRVDRLNLKPCKSNEDVTRRREFEESIKSKSSHVSVTVFEHSSVNAEEIKTQSSSFVSSEEIGEVKKKIKPAIPVKSKATERIAREKSKRISSNGKEEIKEGFEKVGRSAQIVSKGKEEIRREKTTIVFETSDQKEEKKLGFENADQIRPKGNPETDTRPVQEESENLQLRTKPLILVKPLTNEEIAQRVSNIEKLQSSLRKSLFEDTPVLPRKNTNSIEDSPIFPRRNSESCEDIETKKVTVPRRNTNSIEDSVNESGKRTSFDQKGTVTPTNYFEDNETTFEQKQSTNLAVGKFKSLEVIERSLNNNSALLPKDTSSGVIEEYLVLQTDRADFVEEQKPILLEKSTIEDNPALLRTQKLFEVKDGSIAAKETSVLLKKNERKDYTSSVSLQQSSVEQEDEDTPHRKISETSLKLFAENFTQEREDPVKIQNTFSVAEDTAAFTDKIFSKDINRIFTPKKKISIEEDTKKNAASEESPITSEVIPIFSFSSENSTLRNDDNKDLREEKPYFNTEDKSVSLRQNSSGINSSDLITKNRVLREDASDLIEKKNSRLRKERNKQSTSSGTFFTEKCASSSEDNSISRQKSSPRTNHINLTSEENQIGEPSEEKKSLSEGEASKGKKSGPSEGNTNLNVDERSEGQKSLSEGETSKGRKSLTESTSVLLRRDSRKRNSSSTKRVSFSPDVEQFPIAAPRKLLTPKTAVEVVTVEVKTVRKESVTPVLVVEDRKKDVNSNYQNFFTLGDSNHSKTVNEDFDHSKEIVSEDSVYVRRTKEDKERFLNTTESFSSDGDRKNLTVEANSKIFCTSEENLIDRNSSKAILRRPAEERNSDSEDLTDTTLITEQDTTDVVLRRPARKSRTVFNILSQNGEESSVLKRNSKINRRSNPSAIFTKVKAPPKAERIEADLYILSRQSSEDSIDKIQSALDQFIMDDKKEKKRTNSFKKIFKNFSRKDKKKSKKVENEDNAQNESANLVEGPPRMNKELPEVPSEEVVKRYAQMHIDRYNQVRANFEEPKYSEDYVCMDNGGNKYSYINTAEVNKYIDTSSSSNTLDSENLAFRDSDNSSGLEVKNELFFDTYQNVQLVKPKANIPINSERPLPLPYQDDSFEVENANNVSMSDRSLSSRSPSLEGSKLKMPVNRDKVDLQPRIRSPIPPSEVSTDKIIATELLKNKKDKRSSPSHQRLEIEIDYPEQNSIPKGKPPISPQSKALLNLEAGEWHRRQREVNAAPTLEWQRKQREGLSPDVEDWAMKQGEELMKKRMSPGVEEWQKKQRERMSPTVEDWQRKMKQGEELQRKRVSPVVQIEDWQSKMRQGEELLRKRVSPGVEEWQTKMKQGEEWQMKQREQMSPGVEDWQRKQREGMRISEEDWRRQRDVKSPPVEDCRRQRGVEDWQHKAGLSLLEMKQQNVSQKNNDDFRRQTNWQRDEISLLERKQKETRSPGIEDCNKRRGVEDWRQRDEISLLQRKQPLNEDAMLEEYGTQRDVEGWQQRDEISLLRRKPPPKKDATPVGAEDYGTQHRKENANPPCDVENWQNKQSKQNHEDLQRKQGLWHKINSEKQQVEIIKDFQLRQKEAMPPKQEGFVRVQRDWQSSPRKQNHVEDCQEIDTTETKLKQRAASPTLEEWRRQQKEILAADQRKQISPTPDKQILAEHQKKVNSLLEWQKIHSKHAVDMVDLRNKIAVDQNDYARRLPSEAYIRAPDQSDYAHRQLVEGSKAAFQDQQKRSPSSETNSSIYSSNYGPQMTTNVLVHVDSHSPQNRSVTPVSRSTTPVTMRSPSNVSLQRTPPKHEIRQSVEAFCWKELKKMKEQEDIQMQIQLSNYGYMEDPIISRRSRSVSQEHARNTRRSSSLPREVQRQRRLEDAGVASRTRVEPIYGQRVVYNPNFVRSSPQRNTIGTSTVQRPIFKRGSLSQNYNNAESQALYYKKVGFHSPQNPENPKAWPTKNGYTQSPPQRRLEVKREVSIEDEVFLPETPKEPLYGIKPKEPIYGGKTKEPTREEIFLMNQQRQRQMRELKEPIYDFRPLPNEQLYRQNGQVYVSRQQPIYGSRVMPNISEEGMYAQKPSLQRNNSFTQRYDYPPNEQMYSRNPQEIYGRLGQKPTTVNNKVCDIYGKIHDGQVQKSGVIYGQLQRNTNAPPTQYQSYNQLQNQNFVRGTRLTASVNDMNRYYQQQDPRFRPQQQQQHAPPDRPLPPIPNDRRPRKPNNSDAEGEVQRIFQTKNRIAEEEWNSDGKSGRGLSGNDSGAVRNMKRGSTKNGNVRSETDGDLRSRSRGNRRDDPRRHTLAGEQYGLMSGQGGPLSRTMDLEGQPRGYPPPSNAMLFDDDPGIMSEVETSSTGFRRGGKQRSSLPVVRTPSKTLERPLGLVFLQYRNETKRALLPNEITSIDTVKALFVRSFPKQLTMEYLDSPQVKIYIHDSSKDMFYELEDLRSHLREIRDRSVLRLFESADVSGGLPMAGIGIAGGVGHFEDPSYFSEPEFDSEYQHQHIHKSKGSTKAAPYYIGSTASLPRAGLLRAYSPAVGNLPQDRIKTLPTDGYMSSPERGSRYEDPYYSQYGTRSGSITPVIDEEVSDTELLDEQYSLYGVKMPAAGPRPAPRTQFSTPAAPPYDATRIRVEHMERQLANLTGLVQKALTQTPATLQVPNARDNYRDDTFVRSETKAPKLGKSGCHKSVSFEKSVSFSDEPPDMNSPKQHSPQHSERDRLKPAPPPKPASLSPGQYDGRHIYRDLQLTPEMYNQLRGLQKKAKDLRAEVRNLRRMSQAQAHSVRETIRDTFIKIRAMLLAGGEQVWQAGMDQERVRLSREEDLYKQEMIRLETDLSDLESTVEELRGNVINRKTRVNMSDVENMALILSKSSKTVADLKLRFPVLQDSMKSMLSTEMEKVVHEEKFLKEEPERLESALRRCKKLTGTLVTLKRLASVQEQRLPCSATAADGRLSPTEPPPITPPPSQNSKPPAGARVGQVSVGGDAANSADGHQRPENALDALLDELQTFSKPHTVNTQIPQVSYTESEPPTLPVKGIAPSHSSHFTTHPPTMQEIGRKGSMDSATLLPTQNLTVSTATGSLRRLHSYPSGSDTDNSPPIQPIQRVQVDVKSTGKPPIPERNADLLQHISTKRVPPPPPPRTSSKSPLASPTSPSLPPRSPATNLQHIQNVQNMVENKPLSQFETATQNLGFGTLRRNMQNRSSLKDRSQTLPRNVGSTLQVHADGENAISASNSSSCESVNSQDGTKKRKEELEQRHQELLKKQKALQEQYARLQQLQRGTNTLTVIPPAPDQLLKKTGSESNILQKMGLQLATSQITGSLTNLPNTTMKLPSNNLTASQQNNNTSTGDDTSTSSNSSSTTNKVYETDIL